MACATLQAFQVDWTSQFRSCGLPQRCCSSLGKIGLKSSRRGFHRWDQNGLTAIARARRDRQLHGRALACGLTASSGTPATLLSSYYFSAALRREQAPPRWFPRCGPTWPHGDRESSSRSAAIHTRTCVSLTCGFTASSSTPANWLSSYDFSAALGRELDPQKTLQETCCVAVTAFI